ncbi:glycosyltransferase family 4 protein [Gilvimarinus sp. F26214L]|uniref:glycosyltransferase family 4 protein n=1 Tax=Gilvimarinus sp. DZF01 TaxID=3461371 RepID=UPI0040455CDB
MNFAFVLFKHIPYGGMQRNMLAIARACAERGHRVTIVCSRWNAEPDGRFAVVELPLAGLDRLRGNGGQMQQFCRAFTVWLCQHPQDLVVGFNKFPGLDAYYAADSCFASKAREEKSWLYRLSARARIYLSYEHAVFGPESHTRILEVSPKERPRFVKHYGTPEERFFPLPPGISRDRASAQNFRELRTAIRRELSLSDQQQVFLAVGSGFRTKGLDRSIQLLADWNRRHGEPAVLLVAGADKDARFRQQASRLGVAEQVHFLGGRSDVPALFQAADVVLHPAYKENTGNVLLEAMIAGRPVIATDVCGYAHYISDAQMGEVLASPFSPVAYLNALERVLGVADQQWRSRGAEFAAREEIYSRPAVAADLLEQFATAPSQLQEAAAQ